MTLSGLEPGTLGATLEAQADTATVRELTLSGRMNARDFDTLRGMEGLRGLDLTDVTIAAYEGEPLATGRTRSAANTLPEYALMGLRLEMLTLPRNLEALGVGSAADLAVTSLELPESLTTIGTAALASNREMAELEIPASVRSIAPKAFEGNEALTRVRILGPVEEIPAEAFASCEKLREVTLPQGLRTIGAEAFRGCDSLQSVVFPGSLDSIAPRAFAGSGVKSVDLSGCTGLRSLGAEAFASCGRLREVSLPSSMEEIGEGAFYAATGMEVELGELLGGTEVRAIPDFAFTGASKARAAQLDSTRVERIGRYALARWESVDTLRLPEVLYLLDDNALQDMKALKYIDAHGIETMPQVGRDVFEGIDQPGATVNVYYTTATDYMEDPQWGRFNIVFTAPSGIEEVGSDKGENAGAGVKAYFQGDMLVVEASEVITSVTLSDVAARTFRLPVGSGATRLTFNTGAISSPIFLVRVTLKDVRTPVSLKLRR